MRPSVESRRYTATKPPQAPKRGQRRADPKLTASKNKTNATKSERPYLPIHQGSIFRWRPSQSLGFQVAAVTSKKARHHSSRSGFGFSSITSASSFLTDTYSMSSLSTFPSESTFPGQTLSTNTHGAESSLFVISKIDPWGPMAIFAPQLRVGMRIVAINHQPCPKTKEGLQALLETSHTSAEDPPPSAPQTMTNKPADGREGDEKSGWITIHAVDVEDEVKQREYYLQLNAQRGMDPDEQRSDENTSFFIEQNSLPVEIREEAEMIGPCGEEINMIHIEIVTKEFKLKPESEKDEIDPALREKLNKLHVLEEKRLRAIAYESKLKRKDQIDLRRQRNERYMERNIWDMKIKTEGANSRGMDSVLDNFSILPAVESRKEPTESASVRAHKQKAKREKLADAKALEEIQKKVRSIEEEAKAATGANARNKRSTKKKVQQQKKNPVRNEKPSDWNILDWLLLSSPPPPPPPTPVASMPPQQKSNPPTPSNASLFEVDESMGSTITSIASKPSTKGWFHGWGLTEAKDDSVQLSNIINNAPKILQTNPSISPQRWACEPSVGKESEVLSFKTKPSTASKKDPDGTRVTPKDVRDPADCPSQQPMQLQKIGKRTKGPVVMHQQGEELLDSMRSKNATEKDHHATVGQLRQLVAHLEMSEKMPPKQHHRSPPGDTSLVKKPPVPFPERDRRKKPEPGNQAQRLQELHNEYRSQSISSVSAIATPTFDAPVSKLQCSSPAARRNQPKAIPVATVATSRTTAAFATGNTTIAFTLPQSRSNSSDEEKRKHVKKVLTGLKAAGIIDANEAYQADQTRAHQEWNISSLFLSVFTCGVVEDVADIMF